jgi:two-component system chemotaxis sensor kinase CheA
MEQMLLAVDVNSADEEELNAIFRCAHSVKGGAATFGFSDVAELTHEMETLLDKLRRRELQPTTEMVDALLASGDALKAQLARHQGLTGEVPETSALLATIRRLVEGGAAPAAPAPTPAAAAPAAAPVAAPAVPVKPGVRTLELRVGPLDNPALADNLVDLFKEITDLGTIEPLDAGKAADGIRRFKVMTASSDNDLLDLFTFHVAREQVRLAPLGPGYGFHEGAPGAPQTSAEPAGDPGYGFFDNAPGAPQPAAAPKPSSVAPAAARPAARADAAKPAAAAADSATLRVSVEKVDQLINLVG